MPNARKPTPKSICPQADGQPALGARFHLLFLIWRLHQRPTYGYALMQEIRQMAVGHKKTSAVYLALERLEEAGLVKSRLDSSGGRMRRLYQTTPKGWALYERIRRRMIRGTLRDFMRALAG
ncbi:Transcriptional regulator PadR-like family protein [uncultured archaeon]|nr:Transcriptional regulator PadR-like family protein [uncultured archaeon]